MKVFILLLFLLGMAAVIAGAALISMPLGLVVAGLCLILSAAMLVIAAGSRKP